MNPAAVLPWYLLRNARVLPNRMDILPLLPKGGIIAEIGVMTGIFSRLLLDHCHPKLFYALDLFDIHTLPEVWGKPTAEVFDGLTHQGFYERTFSQDIAAGRMKVLAGNSHAMLEHIPDGSLDVAYIDADHTYPAVAGELRLCAKKLKPETGLIIVNDYVMVDSLYGGNAPYGVIQATNDFMIEEGWEMVAFVLQDYMFCDVVLRKLPRSRFRRIMQRIALNAGYRKLGRF